MGLKNNDKLYTPIRYKEVTEAYKIKSSQDYFQVRPISSYCVPAGRASLEQLMRWLSSKCCSWPSRVWTILFLLTCLILSSSVSQWEKICAPGINIFFVFHVCLCAIGDRLLSVAGPRFWNALLPIFFSPFQSAFSKSP